jgi:hypothetical protein
VTSSVVPLLLLLLLLLNPADGTHDGHAYILM